MAQKIVVTILPNGETKIDAQGFAGNSCSIATKELEQVLVGGGKVDDTKKPEFFAPAGQGAVVDNRNRF